jgi:hypothetical protein
MAVGPFTVSIITDIEQNAHAQSKYCKRGKEPKAYREGAL